MSKGVLPPDRGDTGCELGFMRLWTTLDVLGDCKTKGLRISLEAETPISRLPFSESRIDLVRLGGPGEGSDGVADGIVGVDGRDMV